MIKVYVNENNEIHDVGTNSLQDPTLTEKVVTDGTFDGWSKAKICCYIVNVNDDGHVTMMTPYVDSRLIAHIDQLGMQGDVNETDITDTEEAIAELYEMITEVSK